MQLAAPPPVSMAPPTGPPSEGDPAIETSPALAPLELPSPPIAVVLPPLSVPAALLLPATPPLPAVFVGDSAPCSSEHDAATRQRPARNLQRMPPPITGVLKRC